MAKVYARRIHDGRGTIAEVPERWQDATKEAYLQLYGEPCPED